MSLSRLKERDRDNRSRHQQASQNEPGLQGRDACPQTSNTHLALLLAHYNSGM